MSQARTTSVQSSPLSPARAGGAAFLTPAHRSERCKELADRGYLLARVGSDGPLERGELREALEGAVEISLALRGALPPSVTIDAPAVVAAQDQVFRVKTLDAAGLCLVVPSLTELADADLHLHPDDSTALDTWRRLGELEPVVLLFDAADRNLRMLAPQALGEVFGEELEVRDSGAFVTARENEQDCTTVVPLGPKTDLPPDADTLPRAARPQAWPDAEPSDEDASRDAISLAIAAPSHETRTPSSRHVPPVQAKRSNRVIPLDPLSDLGPLDADLDDDFSDPFAGNFDPAPQLPLSLETYDRYRRELDDADGPKPVRAVEALFRTRYVPLHEALQLGLDDPEVERVVRHFSRTFEKSYREGFQAMRLTGKRPTMVLDAPDLAAKIGRAHGARGVQLLLVDGLRYDLGLRVREVLSESLEGSASCVEQTLMWSALPTVTPVQMRLLSMGPRGLREGDPTSDRDPVIHREGSVTTLRRVRIGQRDLVKLDVVEARLRETGPGFDARMDRLAGEVGEIVTELVGQLPSRTLLYVFGDHGFQLPVLDPQATGPAEQGGASPEEVLVPGHAWLIE